MYHQCIHTGKGAALGAEIDAAVAALARPMSAGLQSHETPANLRLKEWPTMSDTAPPHPSEFIAEEMEARGWDRWELARRMGGDYRMRRLEIDLYFEVGPGERNLRIGDGEDFARAFGVSAEFFRNLEAAWLKSVLQ
jgi:hypothetical protein